MVFVTYFLLAGGPSLLVRLGAAWSGGETGAQLLQIATKISEDLGRYFATVTLSNLLSRTGNDRTMHWLGMPNAFVVAQLPSCSTTCRTGLGVTVTLLTSWR